jgi:nuclear GTP-binding protein
MAKKQSKRTTLKDKYKIERKVKQHKKKLAKAAKKRIGHNRPKMKKDLGIPNLFPHKDKILRQMEARRRSEMAEKQRLREKRARERQVATRRAKSQQDQMADMVRTCLPTRPPAALRCHPTLAER